MKAGELFKQGRIDDIWSYYCGWIDLSTPEFMEIQKRLLMEQIELLGKCELGRTLMRGHVPSSPEEFRSVVPLTTYSDYIPFLAEKKEDALPVKPCSWIRTSGRSQQFDLNCKWVPVAEERRSVSIRYAVATFIFAGCAHRGNFPFRPEDRFLYCAAPRPYASGEVFYHLPSEFPFRFLPSVEEAEGMSFQERVSTGFELALSEGLDGFAGLSSILVAVGERFSQFSLKGGKRHGSITLSAALRLGRAYVRSKLAKRPLLPKDIWTLKAIATSGSDTEIYRERIKELWGRYPLNVYSATEAGSVAVQLWNYKGMCFVPDTSFYEFIPEAEYLRSKADPAYQPRTLLLDEVEAGERYEIVFTGLHGSPFVRYRIGDMIKIVALRDDELGVDIPQMEFVSRCDSIIDLAGFARLTEAIIWQAIEDTGIAYTEWTAHKESDDAGPTLHIYLEPASDEHPSAAEAANALHQVLVENDEEYSALDNTLGLKPVRISWLAPGTFQQYGQEEEAAGSDLGHQKAPHTQPSEEVLETLLRIHRDRSSA